MGRVGKIKLGGRLGSVLPPAACPCGQNQGEGGEGGQGQGDGHRLCLRACCLPGCLPALMGAHNRALHPAPQPCLLQEILEEMLDDDVQMAGMCLSRWAPRPCPAANIPSPPCHQPATSWRVSHERCALVWRCRRADAGAARSPPHCPAPSLPLACAAGWRAAVPRPQRAGAGRRRARAASASRWAGGTSPPDRLYRLDCPGRLDSLGCAWGAPHLQPAPAPPSRPPP